jgi:hypothetical protein
MRFAFEKLPVFLYYSIKNVMLKASAASACIFTKYVTINRAIAKIVPAM